MALLPEEKRKEILEYLGYEYSEAGIRKLQSDYMLRKKDSDGIWGRDTENTALTVYYTKKHTKNFSAKEFRCDCGGRHCCGYPDFMKPEELVHIQTIRDHYGRPITVTSGLRCKGRNNELRGSAENSGHMTGYAIDFYQAGVTDTLAARKKSIEYFRSLPNHKFSYGKDMKGTDDIYRSASYMGNAMHTETKPGSVEPQKKTEPKKESTPSKLTVDGIAGVATIKAAQHRYGTVVDGYITGQRDDLKKYYPNIIAVRAGKGGSALVRAIQQWTRTTVDGIWGKGTTIALQKKLKELGYYSGELDGIAGKETVTAWQHYLNGDTPQKKDEPKKESDTVIDVSDFQDTIDWSKVKTSGIAGAIVKCGRRGGSEGGLFEDKRFIEHIKGAYAAGLKVGVYFFTEAINAAEGTAEADYTLELIKKAGLPLSYPVGIDTENVFWYETKNGKKVKCKGRANSDVLSKAKRTEAIKAFCEEIKAKGYEPMIYASLSWFGSELDMSKLPYKVWCAQYNSKCDYEGKYVLWQYTSDGSVPGVKGDVDMNHCYMNEILEPEKKKYTGELPTLVLKKSTEEVIEDAIRWCFWIAYDNAFHYGYTNKHGSSDSKDWNPNAHHNGCYFCGTNVDHGGRSKKGIVDFEHTYCCNPAVTAAYAHGGCDQAALKKCRSGSSYVEKSFKSSKNWKPLGKPKFSSLKKGEVLYWEKKNSCHYAIYLGNGKLFEASGGDDNKRGSKKWNNSIHIRDIDSWGSFTGAFRYIGTVDTSCCIYHGEISKRVILLQKYLIWYGLLPSGSDDGIFGDATRRAVEQLQKDQGLTVDGIVGNDTLTAMGKVVK